MSHFLAKATKGTMVVYKGRKRRTTKNSLASKVRKLERLTNDDELKYHIITQSPGIPFVSVGQLNGNVSGAQLVDVSMVAPQGTDVHQRLGNKVVYKKLVFRCAISGQGQTTGQVRYRIEFWKNKGVPIVSTAVLTELYLPNPWIKAVSGIDIYDMHCERNPDKSSNFTKIKTINGMIKPENFQYNTMQLSNIHNVTIGMRDLKVNFTSGITYSNNYQILMLVLADCGNMSSSLSTVTGVVPPSLIGLTGLLMSFAVKNYYTDD